MGPYRRPSKGNSLGWGGRGIGGATEAASRGTCLGFAPVSAAGLHLHTTVKSQAWVAALSLACFPRTDEQIVGMSLNVELADTRGGPGAPHGGRVNNTWEPPSQVLVPSSGYSGTQRSCIFDTSFPLPTKPQSITQSHVSLVDHVFIPRWCPLLFSICVALLQPGHGAVRCASTWHPFPWRTPLGPDVSVIPGSLCLLLGPLCPGSLLLCR